MMIPEKLVEIVRRRGVRLWDGEDLPMWTGAVSEPFDDQTQHPSLWT